MVAPNGPRPALRGAQDEPQGIVNDLARSNNPAHTPTKCENQAPLAIQLNARWRVVVCRDGIQWILQRRNVRAGTGGDRPERHSTDDWRGRAYCRTREA